MSSVAMSNVPATARAPVVASRFEARMPFWSAAAAAEASYSLVPVVEPEVSTLIAIVPTVTVPVLSRVNDETIERVPL